MYMFSCVLMNKCELSKFIKLDHGVLNPNQYIYNIISTPKAQGTSHGQKYCKSQKIRRPAAGLSSIYDRKIPPIKPQQ